MGRSKRDEESSSHRKGSLRGRDIDKNDMNNGNEESLSIDETNKLRISLGLKPLEIDKEIVKDTADITKKGIKKAISTPTKDEEKKSTSWSKVAYESLYGADEEGDELNPVSWVLKQRKKASEHAVLAQQANHTGNFTNSKPALSQVYRGVTYSDDEDDEELLLHSNSYEKTNHFDISKQEEKIGSKGLTINNIQEFKEAGEKSIEVEKEKRSTKLHISHDIEDIKEGNEVILTLADGFILDDKGELNEDDDILENIELKEGNIREKHQKDKQKKALYDPTLEDEGSFDPQTGRWIMKEKPVLPHYDEWAEGAKPKPLKHGFDLQVTPDLQANFDLNKSIHKQSLDKVITSTPTLFAKKANTQTNTGTATFKSSKKKHKPALRSNQPLSWDEIFKDEPQTVSKQSSDTHTIKTREPSALSPKAITYEENTETHSTTLPVPLSTPPVSNIQILPPRPTSNIEEENDDYNEFYELLARQRRRHLQLNQSNDFTDPTHIKVEPKIEPKQENDVKVPIKTEKQEDLGLTLSYTTEFCRTVQTPPEKIQSIKSESYTGSALFREQHINSRRQIEEPKKSNKHTRDSDDQQYSDMEQSDNESFSIDDDTVEDDGKIAFLHEKQLDGTLSCAIEYLKQRGDISDDKWRKERSNPENTPSHTSTDPSEIKLEYKDQYGRVMTSKEAFQHISWTFHGKGPGKTKQQSRLKRMEIERKLKDNPLEALPTLKALEYQQQANKTAHLYLTGNQQN